jgi:hypothetical protein
MLKNVMESVISDERLAISEWRRERILEDVRGARRL